MVNICESLINVVSSNKPKMLISPRRAYRLGPKGKWSGTGVLTSPVADIVPPAKGRDLTRAGMQTKRGKPVVLPYGESEPQSKPMGLRIKDGGGSESLPVMGRIGVAPPIRATSPHAKAGRLPPGLSSRET